jgi:hypothetical protein
LVNAKQAMKKKKKRDWPWKRKAISSKEEQEDGSDNDVKERNPSQSEIFDFVEVAM